jgi:phage terminase large subunit
MNDDYEKLIAMVAFLNDKLKREFSVESFCFKEQLAFINDQARFKTAVCSRRAGKTIACAADLIDTCLKNKNVVCLYITLSRINAKRIVWPDMQKINREYNLNGVVNNTELSITFPNGSILYASGAKDKSEIENFRGLPIKKVYIDECGSFRPYIEELIDEVLSKALFDHNGTLCLIGTPASVPTGYFYMCSHSDKWSNHAWTMFENPFLEKKSGRKAIDHIKEDCERMGVEISHPKIQRECFGKWVVDTESLVFCYNKDKNNYINLPNETKWNHVIGVDIGFDDADAIAVLAWSDHNTSLYLVDEIITRKQGVTALAAQIETMIKKYDPMKIVMDTGGLGKKIADELNMRFSLPIVAAEKSRKLEYIEIFNDMLRTERFFAKSNSAFALDAALVEWDYDRAKQTKVISDKYHSDICDSILYAARECLHWLSEPLKSKPKENSDAWYKLQIEQMEKLALDNIQTKEEDPWGEENIWT